MYEDRILLRLKRKYKKDEEVSFILKALSDAQFENGVLKSEIAEIKAGAKREKPKVEKPKVAHKEPVYPEVVANNLVREIEYLKKANNNLKHETYELRHKINLLTAELEKFGETVS